MIPNNLKSIIPTLKGRTVTHAEYKKDGMIVLWFSNGIGSVMIRIDNSSGSKVLVE